MLSCRTSISRGTRIREAVKQCSLSSIVVNTKATRDKSFHIRFLGRRIQFKYTLNLESCDFRFLKRRSSQEFNLWALLACRNKDGERRRKKRNALVPSYVSQSECEWTSRPLLPSVWLSSNLILFDVVLNPSFSSWTILPSYS